MPLSGGELASRTEERRVGACFTGSHRGRGRYRYRGRFPVSSHEGIAAEGFDTDPDRDPDPENIFTPAILFPPFPPFILAPNVHVLPQLATSAGQVVGEQRVVGRSVILRTQRPIQQHESYKCRKYPDKNHCTFVEGATMRLAFSLL